MITGLIFVALGFLMILAFRHDLSVVAVIVSFIVLELGVGISQTVSNDTIVASVPAAKAGAASAVSETAYELGAVVGTATLGTIFTAFYRNNIQVPAGLTPAQATDAGESIGGATSVAADLPAKIGDPLLETARIAFDSGIAPTALIAAALALAAAGIVATAFPQAGSALTFRGFAGHPRREHPGDRGCGNGDERAEHQRRRLTRRK